MQGESVRAIVCGSIIKVALNGTINLSLYVFRRLFVPYLLLKFVLFKEVYILFCQPHLTPFRGAELY